MDPFDRLPAELIKQILLELPTTRRLHSLIRASPKCFQVFLVSKSMILVSLMRRRISPTAFIDALAAVQASQLKERGPDRKQVLTFLRKYEIKRHRNIDLKGQHFSLDTAVSLCQLYRYLQGFIGDLSSRSNFYLQRCGEGLLRSLPWAGLIGSDPLKNAGGESSVDRDPRYALSHVEEGRLQRAFYRHELYTQIFSSDMEYKGEKLWELPSDTCFFLRRYQHFEIEELICVETYLWSRLSSTFDQIEPNFVGIQLPEPPLDDSDIPRVQSYSRSVALREAKFTIHSLYADYLLSLSLPFLYHALQLDRLNMQRKMSTHIYYDGQKRSLSTASKWLEEKISHEERNAMTAELYPRIKR